MAVEVAAVEALLGRLYLGGGSLRQEDRKKALEVTDLLTLIERLQPQPSPRGKPRTLVDAAAGHGYVGLCAAALLGWRRVVAIERSSTRLSRVREAAAHLDVPIELELRAGMLGVDVLIPTEVDLVVALHACGAATDGVLSAACDARARFILCAPCCYGVQIDGWEQAQAEANRLGLPDQPAIRHRFSAALIDGARVQRLKTAGYDAKLLPFTAPTVTPHNLAFIARRGGYGAKTAA